MGKKNPKTNIPKNTAPTKKVGKEETLNKTTPKGGENVQTNAKRKANKRQREHDIKEMKTNKEKQDEVEKKKPKTKEPKKASTNMTESKTWTKGAGKQMRTKTIGNLPKRRSKR